MAIVDDNAGIAAELRRIQAERASHEQPKPQPSLAGPYATMRSIQMAIRSGRILPRRPASDG